MTNTTTHKTNRRLGRRMLVVMALGAAALMAIPATGFAAAKFGANLHTSSGTVTQPANSSPAHYCDPIPGDPCTRVAIAFGDTGAINGNVRAPKDGVIDKIKLVAGTVGHFRLQLAKVKDLNQGTGKAKVVEQGPKISHGSSVQGLGYKIQTIDVNVPVQKGEYLAMKSKRTSVLKCQSGSTEQLLFQPPLHLGDPFQPNESDDDCTMLLQAVYE